MDTYAHPPLSDAARAIVPVEDDEALVRLIALFLQDRLLRSATQPGATLLREMGWAEELVSEFVRMPVVEVARLLSGAGTGLGVTFDGRRAAAVVNSYRARRREEQELEFFIAGGATPALIRRLFPKVSSRVVAQVRKRLGQDSRGGRPPLADEETAHRIYRCWQTLCAEEPDLRRRYLKLKERFPTLSLATLNATVEAP